MQATITFDNEQDPQHGRDVTITYTGNLRGLSSSYFNPNAFPDNARDRAKWTSSRFAILHSQIKLIHRQIEIDKRNFILHLEAPEMGLKEAMSRRNLDRFIAKFDGLELMIQLHGLFYALKSFLDLYAALMSELVMPGQPNTFGSSTVDGENISGGRFVKWLRNSSPAAFPNAEALADILQRESLCWITSAVAHRDTLGHYRDIENIHSWQVPLSQITHSSDPVYSDNELRAPQMPDGTLVDDYAVEIGRKVRSLVQITITQFPSIDQDKLDFSDFDMDEPDWSEPRPG